MTGKSPGETADRQPAGANGAVSLIKVVRGKDGWLFLDFDTNQVMAQVQGRLRLSIEQLRQWQFLLENRIAWLASQGIHYLFLVAPVPHVVFPDKLPERGQESERPMLQLLQHLESERSLARVMYPIDQLVECRGSLIYTKTNTHWTDRGAFIAYQALAEEIALSMPIRRLDDADIDWVEITQAGDLGNKLRPEEESPHVFSHPRNPKARLVYDNGILNEGRRAEFECDTAPEGTCLVLGTSSALSLVHLLAEGFRRVVFGNISTLDYTLVNEVRPDVVISVFGERFMVRVPEDIRAPTIREFEARKRAAGSVFPPTSGHWRTRLIQPAQ